MISASLLAFTKARLALGRPVIVPAYRSHMLNVSEYELLAWAIEHRLATIPPVQQS